MDVFIVKFSHCCGVCIIDFEELNGGWDHIEEDP